MQTVVLGDVAARPRAGLFGLNASLKATGGFYAGHLKSECLIESVGRLYRRSPLFDLSADLVDLTDWDTKFKVPTGLGDGPARGAEAGLDE